MSDIDRRDMSRQSSQKLGGALSSQSGAPNGGAQEAIPVDASMNHYELPNLT